MSDSKIKKVHKVEGADFRKLEALYDKSYEAAKQDFQHWKLKVMGSKAVLTCDDGNSDEALVTQDIEFTDFPHDISFYLTDNVLMLPSEY